MAENRQLELDLGHAAAVIRHTDKIQSAAPDFNVDVRCPRIDGVLQKLLDNGCGPLDDLAGRYLIHEFLVENAYR